jgi:hypothetical protein
MDRAFRVQGLKNWIVPWSGTIAAKKLRVSAAVCARAGKPELRASPWDGETTAIQEFRGDFHLSQQRELSVGFGSEYAGVSFRRSETRLSGGVTPFHHPRAKIRLSRIPSTITAPIHVPRQNTGRVSQRRPECGGSAGASPARVGPVFSRGSRELQGQWRFRTAV